MRPLLLLAASLLAACARSPGADLVIYGRVWTGDSARPWAAAVATRGDTVLAVGDSTEIARLAGSKTLVIAAQSGLVTPGFMDDHVHLMTGGFQLARVGLRDGATPREVTRRVKAFPATL